MIQNSRKPRNIRNRSRQPSNFSGSGKIYESNGPDIKIRGSAEHIVEKYTTLARELGGSGDRVIAESYSQFAEHYQRLVSINIENDNINNIERNDKANSVEVNVNEPIKQNKDTNIRSVNNNESKNRSHSTKKNVDKDNECKEDIKSDIPDVILQNINIKKELELSKADTLNDQES
jgi:hypothetical protein